MAEVGVCDLIWSISCKGTSSEKGFLFLRKKKEGNELKNNGPFTFSGPFYDYDSW